MPEKIKVFDYCWHIPHQWDMVRALRNDCEFYYCMNIFATQWDTSKRPVPEEVHFVPCYEPGLYDVALLHMDQGVMWAQSNKTFVYHQFNDTIRDIPKIVLNHGTPVLPEFFDSAIPEEEMQRRCIERVRTLVGNNTMVVNSRTAATDKEWGFGYPIVHGMDPDEWLDLPKEPRAFTALSPYGFDEYYNRPCMGRVADILYDEYGYILQYARLNVSTGSTPEEYKRYLGKSLIYVDTSFRTPMNRARTEAFLSGCCVVQVEGAHDLEYWARPGENIILVPDDPAEIARVIADLLDTGYQKALAIGQEGKKMARKEFSPERYRQDWLALLHRVISEQP